MRSEFIHRKAETCSKSETYKIIKSKLKVAKWQLAKKGKRKIQLCRLSLYLTKNDTIESRALDGLKIDLSEVWA